MENIRLAAIECTENRSMSGIEELAANIAAVGLIQPIVLAELEAGRYRLLAGRRRFRALQQLGRLELAPTEYCLYPTKCDFNFDMVAFCENFHRANLTLAEEVEQFNRLKTDKLTIKELAALLGKTVEYVALRLNLTNLAGKWKEVLNHPEEYPQWTPAKLEIIAKQPAEIQEENDYFRGQTMTVKELNDSLAENYSALKSAPFDITGCAECPKRSGAAELLFPELSKQGDTCLDRECFEKKLLKVVRAEIDAIKKRLAADPDAEPFYLFYESHPDYGSEAYKLIEYIDSDFFFTREKKGKKENNAYCVWGKGAGTYCRVKPKGTHTRPLNPKKADGTPAAPASLTDETGKKVKTLADREAELLAKRTRLATQKMIEFLEDEDDIALLKLRESRADNFQDVVLSLAYQFGTDSRDGYCSDVLKDYQECHETIAGKLDAYLEHAWHSVSGSIVNRLSQVTNSTLDNIKDNTPRAFCEILNWNYDELFFNPAAEEIKPSKALLAARAAEAAEAK